MKTNWDVLQESAQNLEELNVRGAWEKLKALGSLTKDSFMRGYNLGRGKAPEKSPAKAPSKGKKKYAPAKAPEKKAPPKGGKEKKAPKAQKRKEKRARKCVKAKNGKIRCLKPGGGYQYYDPKEFARLHKDHKI